MKKKYPRYMILGYYCFENYLYHPDNLDEAINNFNREEYLQELISQKNTKLTDIMLDIKGTRKGYTDLNHELLRVKKNSTAERNVIELLKSDILEEFYIYFDMAGKNDSKHGKSFDKSYLNKYSYSLDSLLKTKWIKAKFSKILAC